MSARSELRLFAGIAALTAVAAGAFWICWPAPSPSAAPRPFADRTVSRAMLMPPGCHTIGPPGARYVLVAFMDLQCPNCRQAHRLIEGFLQAHRGDLAVVVHHYQSTPAHEHEPLLARAVEAAARQGEFEPMMAGLFAMQDDFRRMKATQVEKAIGGLAVRLGLDMARFRRDWKSADARAAYESDRALARKVKMTMPGFFFCGPQGPPVRLFHLMQMRDWLSDPEHWR